MRTFEPGEFGIGRLFHQIRDAVIVADAHTERIVLWNQAAIHLFGYSTDEALELPLHSLVPDELKEIHRAGVARYRDSGSGKLVDSGHPVELEALHRDGHRVPVELALTPLSESPDEVHRFVIAIIRDASERKAAEESRALLREAEIRKKQALDLNDTIVQGLAAATMALELGKNDKAFDSLRQTLDNARLMVTDLLNDIYPDGISPGDLVRDDPHPSD